MVRGEGLPAAPQVALENTGSHAAADSGLQPVAFGLGSSFSDSAPLWVFCLLLKRQNLIGRWSPSA